MPIAHAPIPDAIRALYHARDMLARAFPQHTFTIDGKIVGDIGESIAIAEFGLEKLRPGTKDHDLKTGAGKLVQVKATQKAPAWKAVGLGIVKRTFEFLLVIEFAADGSYEVLYNGPGDIIDAARAHKKGATLSRIQLRQCQTRVPLDCRIVAVSQDDPMRKGGLSGPTTSKSKNSGCR